MSATTNIYVTPSTSLVLIKSLSSVTNVYLGSFATLFSVTIRDTTGLSSIRTTPVNISTTGTAKFADGTSYYPLDRPYGLVNISLRNSNTWQVNHTSGKPPSLAAANVQTLSTMSSFFAVASTAQKFVSTFVVENLTSPNSINITSPFIVSNLSTPGFVLMNQQLTVFDNVTLNNVLRVKEAVRIFGSTYTNDLAPLNGSTIQVFSSVGVGGRVSLESLYVKSTLTLFSTIQVSTLQVTQSTLTDGVMVTGGARIGGLISTLGNLAVGRQTVVGRNVVLQKEVSSTQGQLSTLNLTVDNSVVLLGNLSTVSTPNTFLSFVSSFEERSSFLVKQSATFLSSFDLSGVFYTSSFFGSNVSTLGSVSTTGLNLLSTASIKGNISTSFFESYQFISIGGNLVTPASISSLSNTEFRSTLHALGNATFAVAHTSSSVGVGGNASVFRSTIASSITIGNDFDTKNLTVDGITKIKGNVGVASNAFVYGSLVVLGEPTISSFLVESFLLNDLQMMTSSPFTSFQVSSLHASTLQTNFTRITRPLPDVTQVSSTYASTTQFTNAVMENALMDTAYTDSFFLGATSSLDSNSLPKAGLNVKTNFAQGLSTVTVVANQLIAGGRVEGNLIGNVSYLSNIPFPFPFVSANTATVSTLTLTNLYTSSFTASTFVIPKFINVQSTVITPYLVLESQGFQPRYNTNQILTLNSNTMVLNRSLFLNNQTKKIGLFVSSPLYDLDISGQIYATNIFFSSINTLNISTSGTIVYSTITVSSSHIQTKLSYGAQGLHMYTKNPFTEDGYFEINTLTTPTSNLFGLYDVAEQSTILLNTGVQVYRQGRVGVNQVNTATGELTQLNHALSVNDTIRTQELYTSTLNLLQSLQTTSLVSPRFVINGTADYPINTLSTSPGKLTVNTLMTIKTDAVLSNRFVGIGTVNPQTSLDVQGTAYFSTLNTFENTNVVYLAMGLQEF